MKQRMMLACVASLMMGCHEPVATEPATDAGNVHVPSAHEIMVGKEKHYAGQLPLLQARNPEAEARAAIANGERHFLCNAGRGSTVPGIAADVFAQVRQHCPTQCLEGVTDALYGTNHRRYLTAALEYSARWNKVMLEACR
jgi:hypothetical protein